MSFEEKIELLTQMFKIIKLGRDYDLDEKSEEALTLISDMQQYFFVAHVYNDNKMTYNVHDDPSVRYFGMDWRAVFESLEDLRKQVREYENIVGQQNPDISQILRTLQRLHSDLCCHLVAVK